jgi:hypothetical protein
MIWLNLQTSVIRAPDYVGAEPVQRATWLNVLVYSCEQENSGRIVGCRCWKDRQWQQTCGVTLAEVDSAAPLLRWNGDDLIVWSYPADKQAEIAAKREAGRRGGKISSEAKVSAARTNGAKHNPSTTQAQPKHNPSNNPTEGKGKERNGMEWNKDSGQIELLQPQPCAAGAAPTADEKWLAEVSNDAAYAGIDVTLEHAKAVRWCATNRKKLSRRRFVNWLNRCDRPLDASANGQPRTWQPPAGEF